MSVLNFYFSINTSFYGFAGNIDLSDLLQSMDDQIRQAKEQAQSRREILDRVEKWRFAAEEEKWLDEYERVDISLSFLFKLMPLKFIAMENNRFHFIYTNIKIFSS